MTTVKSMLKNLENCLRAGDFTAGTKVEELTLCCFTGKNVNGGIDYYQMFYETMGDEIQRAFKGKSKGYQVGSLKLIAVFNAWPPVVDGPKDLGR